MLWQPAVTNLRVGAEDPTAIAWFDRCVAAEAPEAMHRAGVGAAPSAEAFLSAVDALIRDLQIPPFSSLRIAKAEHPRIAAMSVANGSNGSNPGDLGVADYMRIIEAAG